MMMLMSCLPADKSISTRHLYYENGITKSCTVQGNYFPSNYHIHDGKTKSSAQSRISKSHFNAILINKFFEINRFLTKHAINSNFKLAIQISNYSEALSFTEHHVGAKLPERKYLQVL